MLEIMLTTIFRLGYCVIAGGLIKLACDAFREGHFFFFGLCLVGVLIPIGYIVETFIW
jgi:hypothetical protein